MKTLQTYLIEAIKPPRLSAKNKALWKNSILYKKKVMKWVEDNCWAAGKVDIVNGNINVNGEISITFDVEEIPYPFGEVTGCFDCEGCKKLKSLKNSPQKVGGDFSCSNCNNLTSLEGAPEEVGGDFSCSYCDNLTSLEGAPKEIGKDFYCNNCGNLTSLKGASKKISGNFYCNDCGKQFTEEDVRKVCKVKGEFFV